MKIFKFLPVIKLQTISGRIINFSILSKSSPGKTKYSICRFEKLASLIPIPRHIPITTPANVAKSSAFSFDQFLHCLAVQHPIVNLNRPTQLFKLTDKGKIYGETAWIYDTFPAQRDESYTAKWNSDDHFILAIGWRIVSSWAYLHFVNTKQPSDVAQCIVLLYLTFAWYHIELWWYVTSPASGNY